MEIRDHALSYAARGWPVFPIKPKDKIPLVKGGFKSAATNENVIERWWDKWSDANVGMATGKMAKVWVLDVDVDKGGAESLAKLQEELGELPETLEQTTGGGGKHLFFAWPGREIRNRANVRPGIDVRAEGGYVVLPPSVHPSGNAYVWVDETYKVADAPKAWLDLVAPPKKRVPPWERADPPTRRPPPPPQLASSVENRAVLYLNECEPAVQGRGGHNALLWAARALVVGFELSDSVALRLLWGHFNPRCQPPWDQESEKDKRDFERKVGEARRTPSDKPTGWLLDEYGLRDSVEALANIARGEESARALLQQSIKRSEAPVDIQVDSDDQSEEAPVTERQDFPVKHFPKEIADFVVQVAESHQVDLSFAALPVLACAGAAMGNAWRFKLKGGSRGYVVPPTLWVALVGVSGTNKSGPLSEITDPLTKPVPLERHENALINPSQELVVGNATLEAVVSRLQDAPRGLLVFRDELAGWANGFDAYRKGGGDEQAWLEFWGAKAYAVDRKTNNERIRIPAASVSVLGGIQPKVMASCFDPGKFASGLVPRILVACPPRRSTYWTEAVVEDGLGIAWEQAVVWLRSRPFEGRDLDSGLYKPHMILPTDEAKAVYIRYHNVASAELDACEDEHKRTFLSKTRVMSARLALIHHGLKAAVASNGIPPFLDRESMEAGVAWARWCLEEQLRVYGFGASLREEETVNYLLTAIRSRLPTNTATPRQVQKLNAKRFKRVEAARVAMEQLVASGHAAWTDERRKKIRLVTA